MKTLPPAKKHPGDPRRWRTPPPLTRGSAESLEGMEILREVDGEIGVLLWQSYRNVMLWASADPAQRGDLFSPAAGKKRMADLAALDASAELETLTEIGYMLQAPETIAGEQVARACVGIAEWAKEAGKQATALAFTQAAALAAPRNASLSLAVGRIARLGGEQARAETWYRHAVMVSRQTADWETYGRAYGALGNMLLLRGNLPGAQRMHVKALRAARRKGLTHIQGMAAHDLFVVATEAGRATQAEEYARMALRCYGADHPSLAALGHDLAYFWMNQGYFREVLPIFRSLLAGWPDTPARTMLVHAHVARAAGGAGDRSLFRRYFTATVRLARSASVESSAGEALLELAMGAASLGEWDRAEQAAEQALELTRKHGLGTMVLHAESVLDSVRGERLAERAVSGPAPAPRTTEALAEQLLGLLTGASG